MYDLALRHEEVTSLDLAHVDLDRLCVHVLGKGRTGRGALTLPVTEGDAGPLRPKQYARESLLSGIACTIIATLFTCGARAQPPGWPDEISGAALLPHGNIVFVDDDEGAIFIWDPALSGPPLRSDLEIPGGISDMEAAATDSLGTLYLITSHSTRENGSPDPRREILVRVAVDGHLALVRDLVPGLFHLLATDHTKLDLEGLTWCAEGESLLLGARSPLHGRYALIISLGPAAALFDESRSRSDLGTVRVAIDSIDARGRGIRGLDYDPWRKAVIVLAGPAGKGAPLPEGDRFGLFLWHPATGEVDSLVVPELATLDQPEAVLVLGPPDSASGEQELLVVAEGELPRECLVKAVIAERSAHSDTNDARAP